MKPAVVGVGNVLLGDEGLGVRLIEDLREEIEAWGADVIEGGTGGYALLGLVEGRPRVVFLDAAQMHLPPGEVRVFGSEALIMGEARGALSGHELDLAATIALLRRTDPNLRVRVVGIEPERVALGEGLSPGIRAKYGEIKDRVKTAIRKELREVLQ